MYFLVFHGPERFHDKPFPPEADAHASPADAHGDAMHDEPDHVHAEAAAAAHGTAHHDAAHDHGHDHGDGQAPHESPWVVTVPLVLLAIPSVVIGFLTIRPMLYGAFFRDAIAVDADKHPAMAEMAHEFHGAAAMSLHALTSLPFLFALAGVALAYLFYIVRPSLPAAIQARTGFIYRILANKYYLDWFNEHVLAAATRTLGVGLWKGGDVGMIDGAINGSASAIGLLAGGVRRVQTGHLYWYALVMILGVVGLMTWQLWPFLSGLAVR